MLGVLVLFQKGNDMIRIRIVRKNDTDKHSSQDSYLLEENHAEQPSSNLTGWHRVAGGSEFPTAEAAARALLEEVKEHFHE